MHSAIETETERDIQQLKLLMYRCTMKKVRMQAAKVRAVLTMVVIVAMFVSPFPFRMLVYAYWVLLMVVVTIRGDEILKSMVEGAKQR